MSYYGQKKTQRTQYRKRYQRKNENKNKIGTKKDMKQDKEIEKLVKKVKQIETDAEVKWADEYSIGSALYNDGLVNNPLSPGPAQGDGATQRTGNQITLTSWHLKAIFLSNVALLEPTRIRCLVVIDNDFNGTNPTLATILDNNTVTDLTLAPRRQDYIKRFKIIYDKMFYLQPNVIKDYDPTTGNTSEVIRTGKHINLFLKIRHKIQYISTSGSTADLTGYVPLFYAVSDRAEGSGQHPIMSFAGRVHFKDF